MSAGGLPRAAPVASPACLDPSNTREERRVNVDLVGLLAEDLRRRLLLDLAVK